MTKINKTTFWVTVFLSVFIPFREIIALYTFDFIKFLPDLIIWPFVLVIIVNNKFKLKFKVYDWAFVAFIAAGFISTLINGTSFLAFALQVRSISTMYVFFYILRNTQLEQKQLNTIVNVLMVVLSVLIVLALLEYFSYKLIFFPKPWRYSIKYASNYARVYSLMNNPNTFAFFSYIVMCLVYFVNRNKHRIIHYVFYTATFLAIFLTASRSAFLVVVLFFAFLIFDTIKAKDFKPVLKMILSIALAIVLLLVANSIKTMIYNITDGFAGVSFSGSLDDSSDSEDDENKLFHKADLGDIAFLDRFNELTGNKILQNSSSDGRIFVIFKGLEIFSDHPIFGTGFGTYGSAGSQMVTPDLYEEYGLYEKLYSDNEYIKVFVETGILGTLIYIAFILLLFKYCLKSRQKALAFISFLFIGMFYNIFEIQSICFVLYLILSSIDKIPQNKTE